MEKVVLLGYMGSGKSTVGQSLATVLNKRHIDLDVYIETEEKLSISQIIAQKGIIYFRKIEQKHLTTLLKMRESYVLSLGGGTPCYYDNMKSISSAGEITSFYLRANVPFLTSRLFEERHDRPLIARFETEESLAEFIGKHLLERSQFYDQANHAISIEDKTVEQIVDEIKTLR